MFIKILGLILCIIVYICFLAYLISYWEKAFRYRFPKCKWLIRPTVILVGLLPGAGIVNFIYHPNYWGNEAIVTIGFCVSAFFINLALFMVVSHILVFICRKILSTGKWLKTAGGRRALISAEIILSALFCFYGLWSANTTSVTHLDVGEGAKALTIVAVADIHFGTPGSMVNIDKMAKEINDLHPDFVFLAGDLFGNNLKEMDEASFVASLNKIKATYGIYAINGNHEYYENDYKTIDKLYQKTKITHLVDEMATVTTKQGELRIVGRDDYKQEKIPGKRIPIHEILEGSDNTIPYIVLDHEPQDYKEAKMNGAFLEVAGHTHNGQLWPGNIAMYAFNKIVFDTPSYGSYTKDDFTLAITRGYGTWGFPLRTIGNAEILKIQLNSGIWK